MMTGRELCTCIDVVVEPLNLDASVFCGRAMVVLSDEDSTVYLNLSRKKVQDLEVILNKVLTAMDGEDYRIIG